MAAVYVHQIDLDHLSKLVQISRMFKAAYTNARRLLRPVKSAWNKARRHIEGHAHDYLRECRGVIHIGANLGQERDDYARRGLAVVWIEPIPDIHEKLVANIATYPKQVAIQALVSERDGVEHTFHISNNDGASSSIFDFDLHKDIWPDVHYTRDLKLTSQTLANALGHIPLTDYDALVIDTQGSELLILKGAEPLLKGFKYIQAEAADFESYRGGCTISDLRAFLVPRGFKEVRCKPFARHPKGGTYYDVLFKATFQPLSSSYRCSAP